MSKQNANSSEQGLTETKEFLQSSEFAALCEKMQRAIRESLSDGLGDDEIAAFTELCRARFGCVPPEGYLSFLQIMNGYECNSQAVYGYAHPDKEPSHFFEDNARMNGKRKYLLIGREDEGYYAYNLKTGEYAGLDSSDYTEDFTYGSFEAMLLHMMWKAFGDEEFEKLFPDFMKLLAEEDAADGELTWDDAAVIAALLCEEHPKLDVLSMTDDDLMELLERECITDMLPPMNPAEKDDILFLLKCAIARETEK